MEQRAAEAEDDADQHRDDEKAEDVHGVHSEATVSIVPRLRLRVGNRIFAPGLVPTLVMLPLLALLLSLGSWQLRRAHEKQVLFDAFAHGTDATVPLPPGATPVPRYAHVVARGRYVPDRQILLDNMTHDERAGYRVLTPLVRNDGSTVLVDRGWVPLVDGARSRLPDVSVGAEEREVSGRADDPPRAGIVVDTPDGTGWPRVLAFPRQAQLERVLGRPLHPQLVLLDAERPDGYVRAWQPPGFPPDRHVGYAVQWFGLALTLTIIYFVVNLKKTDPEP